MKLVIRVKEIRGNCPVYKEDDTFVIDEGYKLSSDIPLCMHSLSSIMPYYIPLSRGVSPKSLGLAKGSTHKAYIQCLDPCKYTGGGTVVFEITQSS
jgi:uncharacterized repeat protein (TIGR04076 family)